MAVVRIHPKFLVEKLDSLSRLYLLYLLLALLTLLIPPLLLPLTILFPTIFILAVTRKNFLTTLPIIGLVGSALFILSAALVEVVGAPVNMLSLLVLSVILVSGVYFLRKRSLPPIDIRVDNDKVVYAIYAIFALALGVRFFSTLGIVAPILHDPVAHAFWAKEIIANNSISEFYSPGLHILSGFLAESTGTTFALSTHYVTNFLNAFSVLSWGLVAYITTRKATFSLLLTVTMFIAPYPALLFFLAGKNAFIAAVAYLPLVFWSIHRLNLRSTLVNAALVAFSLLAIFFLHYPVFAFALGFSGLSLLTSLIMRRSKDDLRQYLVTAGIALGIVVVATTGWLFIQRDSFLTRNETSVEQAEDKGSFDLGISTSEIKSSLVNTYSEFKATTDNFSTFFFPLAIASVLFMALFIRGKVSAGILLFTLGVVTIPFLINLFEIKSLRTTRGTGVMLSFQVFALAFSYSLSAMISKFKPRRWLSILMCFAVCLGMLYVAQGWYTQFHNKSQQLSAVNRYDLAAFTWIEENVDPNEGIINNAQVNAVRSQIILPTDGGMWIPVYTDYKVSATFLEFISTETHENYELYDQIRKGESVMENLTDLSAKGYRYYYMDQGVYGAALNPDVLPGDYFKLVYQNAEVKIYEILL